MPIVLKYLITAALVVLISEIAKRSDQLGALIASLPIVTFLVLIWLHLENEPSVKITNHAFYTFWYVVPTLPMFLVFPYFHNQFGFWIAIGLCMLMTFVLLILWALLVKQFGIMLL
jgi:F0F1-type ATP synthase assembly protein I